MPYRLNNRTFYPLPETPCAKNRRCQINGETGWSLLSIGQIQRRDAGTYLCSAETINDSDNCEMSFNFTGIFVCILLIMSLLRDVFLS